MTRISSLSDTVYIYNNLCVRGHLWLDPYEETSNWIVKDNIFHEINVYDNDGAVTNRGYNAYINTNTYLGGGTNIGDIVTNSLAYDIGPLGRFYQLTNSVLINAGSCNATNAGLYHYTTATNQVKETNSTVDIGYHYVALGTNGQPYDSDGEGLPDYLEDANGNGIQEGTETDWQAAHSDLDGVNDYLEILQGRNPLVNGCTNDFNGSLNFWLYTPLK